MSPEDELQTLRTAVRHVAHELYLCSVDILEDTALFGSPEDLAARLTALGKRLMDALEPPQSGDPGFGGGG